MAPLNPKTQPAEPAIFAVQLSELLMRGDSLLGTGDVASARLFYERGANAGDGTAALRLGATFDTAFLALAHLGLVAGDPAQAAFWYRRARDLGNREAEILLQSAGSAPSGIDRHVSP
jgi:TPR repeat protein